MIFQSYIFSLNIFSYIYRMRKVRARRMFCNIHGTLKINRIRWPPEYRLLMWFLFKTQWLWLLNWIFDLFEVNDEWWWLATIEIRFLFKWEKWYQYQLPLSISARPQFLLLLQEKEIGYCACILKICLIT